MGTRQGHRQRAALYSSRRGMRNLERRDKSLSDGGLTMGEVGLTQSDNVPASRSNRICAYSSFFVE